MKYIIGGVIMKIKKLIGSFLGLIFLLTQGTKMYGEDKKELNAKIDTTMGMIEVKLFHDKVPLTVSNFVTLARKGFYNGIVFHRVIPKFMIQTGDPQGNGTGGPGYSFADEFNKELRHSKPGILSMANAGPNTNGSQFFITVAPTPHLDDHHSVFGEVISGMDIAIKISEAEAVDTKPKKEIKINKIEIVGDWFKPQEVKKETELSDDEIKKLSDKSIEKLAEKIGEAQGLGKLKKVTYQYGKSKGNKIQAGYMLEFKDSKNSQLVFMGEAKNKSIVIEQFQFARGG